MTELIQKVEKKTLNEFLSLSDIPEVTMTYHELMGFIFGIAITPKIVQPADLISTIFGYDLFESSRKLAEKNMMGTLVNVIEKHSKAFWKSSLAIPFEIDTMQEEEFEKVVGWSSGLEEALALYPECWEEDASLTDEEAEHLINSLIVIEGIVYPEDAQDMFDHIPKADLLEIGVDPSLHDLEKIAQVQFFMLQALELSVETLIKHGFKQDKIRKKGTGWSSQPFEKMQQRIDIEAMCPCDSTKRLGECCGISQSREKKKGELIKVNFPKHGRIKKVKNPLKKSPWGSYVLEITLAGIEPEIRRVLEVPAGYTLEALHTIIQLSFGWERRAMHKFDIGVRSYGPQLADDYDDDMLLDESRFTLADFERDFLQGVVYSYDYESNWQHVIMLKKVISQEHSSPYPVVIEGAMACPPEDVGGAEEYARLLRYLAGGDFDGIRDEFPGIDPEGFDPEYFLPEEANSLLVKIFASEEK